MIVGEFACYCADRNLLRDAGIYGCVEKRAENSKNIASRNFLNDVEGKNRWLGK